MEEEEPVIELTEEEKKLWYRKCTSPDISEKALSSSFSSFSLPEESEGFDDIRYEWKSQDESKTYLSQYVLNLKKTQKVEGLKPGTWFTEELKKWQKLLSDWKRRQTEWKEPGRKKQLLAKLKTEFAKKKAEEDGEDGDAKGEAIELPEVNADDLDISSVEDVMNIGSGEPLFANFAYEDWTLLSFRYECHLLLHSFRKDMNDPDRIAIPERHFGYYYQKYLNKAFELKSFALPSFEELIELVKEHIVLSDSMLEPAVAEDEAPDNFVKCCEENRRERLRRVDAGDETAMLKFAKPSPPSRPPVGGSRPQAGGQQRGGTQQNGGGSHGRPGGGYGGNSSYGSQKRPLSQGGPPPPSQRPRYGQSHSGYGSSYPRSGTPYGRR